MVIDVLNIAVFVLADLVLADLRAAAALGALAGIELVVYLASRSGRVLFASIECLFLTGVQLLAAGIGVTGLTRHGSIVAFEAGLLALILVMRGSGRDLIGYLSRRMLRLTLASPLSGALERMLLLMAGLHAVFLLAADIVLDAGGALDVIWTLALAWLISLGMARRSLRGWRSGPVHPVEATRPGGGTDVVVVSEGRTVAHCRMTDERVSDLEELSLVEGEEDRTSLESILAALERLCVREGNRSLRMPGGVDWFPESLLRSRGYLSMEGTWRRLIPAGRSGSRLGVRSTR